jgi:hypothetical protein
MGQEYCESKNAWLDQQTHGDDYKINETVPLICVFVVKVVEIY